MNKKIIQKAKTKISQNNSTLQTEDRFSSQLPVFFYVWKYFFRQKNKAKSGQKMLVELPDTASGSEPSRGYHSTHIVFCFGLGKFLQAAENETSKCHGKIVVPQRATIATLFPLYDNSDPTET